MKKVVTRICLMLAVGMTTCLGAAAQSMDSLWVRLVNDSSLVIRPETPIDTLDAAQDSLTVAVIDPAKELLMARQDSILRAERLADSLRLAYEDSITRALARMDSLIVTAQDYQDDYFYAKAIICYNSAAQMCMDKTLEETLRENAARCEFALKHTSRIPQLNVIARQKFSVDDFFLYYPLPDKSWHDVDGAPAMYYTGDEDEVFVSRDAALEMVYPMTFGDRMYFSSRLLNGFGGYDLFYCDWNDTLGEWGEPKNMGFPYSSSGDDFLFVESEDGKYDIFASNRGCDDGSDSVYVYVIEKTAKPKYITNPSPAQLATISALVPKEGVKAMDNAAGNAQTSNQLSHLYKELGDRERELRARLESAESEERPTLQGELDSVVAEKKRVEQQMFEEASLRDRINAEKDHELAGLEGAYLFTRKSLGKRIKVNYNEN